MKIKEQLELLNNCPHSFSGKIKQSNQYPITTSQLDILQLNISRKCNLECKHCHVEAGPHREEIMSKKVLTKCIELLKSSTISTLDITGGAPEMNPHLEWLLIESRPYAKRIIVRTNLVILKEEKYKRFLDIYTNHTIEICASLPHFSKKISERQRGCGSFSDSLDIIKQLNDRGYGKEGSGLILDLVHNPVGCFLPGNQKALEYEYKERLFKEHGIHFNTLFCITNMPLGRYLEYLLHSENLNDYMNELVNAFNPEAAENIMCKNTLSISWDGKLYNCDFNQMLNLESTFGEINNVLDFQIQHFKGGEIVIHNHCFGCTAGSGSSCQGAVSN